MTIRLASGGPAQGVTKRFAVGCALAVYGHHDPRHMRRALEAMERKMGVLQHTFRRSPCD